VARKAATLSLAAILEQIFDHGFFHADPHAGNLFFLEEEGKIGFIDLGLVGQLEPEDKKRFLKVLLALLKRDKAKLAKSLFDLGTPGKKTDFKAFDKDIHKLLDEVQKKGVDSFRIQELVNRLLEISNKHKLYIPNRYLMMLRSCLVVEGLARSLDPQLSLFKIATPIVAKSLLKSYNPLRFLRRF
jgi:ubiquinone biosynthesis protein